MLASANLRTLLDSIAAGVSIAEEAFGILGSEAGTVSKGAADNAALLATLDSSVQADLVSIFVRRALATRSASIYPALRGSQIQRALDIHFGRVGQSLNAFLVASDLRVHPNLNRIGMMIDAASLFYPNSLDPVAQYEGSVSGGGIFEAGSEINPNEYAAAGMELVVEDMGGTDRTLRLEMRRFDGTTETVDLEIPADTEPGETFDIGSDRYVGVAAIATVGVGGTADDRFRVRSKVERSIVL